MKVSVVKKAIAVACSVALAASMVGVATVQAVAREIAGIVNSQGIVADTVYGVFDGKYAVMGKNDVSNIYSSNGSQVTAFTSSGDASYYGTLRGGSEGECNQHVGYLYSKGSFSNDTYRIGACYFDGTEILPCEYSNIRIDSSGQYLIAMKPDYSYEIFAWPSLGATDIAQIHSSKDGALVYEKKDAQGKLFYKPASGSEMQLAVPDEYTAEYASISDGMIEVVADDGTELYFTTEGKYMSALTGSLAYFNGKYYYATADYGETSTFAVVDSKGDIVFIRNFSDDSYWEMPADYIIRRGSTETDSGVDVWVEIYKPAQAAYVARFVESEYDAETEDAIPYIERVCYEPSGNYVLETVWRYFDSGRDYITSIRVLDVNGNEKYSVEQPNDRIITFANLMYRWRTYPNGAYYELAYNIVPEGSAQSEDDEEIIEVFFDENLQELQSLGGLIAFPEECQINGKQLYYKDDYGKAYYDDGTTVSLAGFDVTGIARGQGQGWRSNPVNNEIGIAWVTSPNTGKYGAVYLDTKEIAIPVEYDAFDDTAQEGTNEVLLKKDGAWFFYSFNEQPDDPTVITTDISSLKLKLAKTSFTYNGKAQALKPTLTLNGQTLKQGTDYVLSIDSVKNAGTYKVTATGLGKYSGTTAAVTVKVAKKANTLTVSPTKKTYKVKNVKKRAQRFAIKVKKNASGGKVGYGVTKKVAKAGIMVTSKGKVTVKKGTKKGTYKVSVATKATTNYKAAVKYVTVVVK